MVVFRSDPCGIVCMGITYSAVAYADYVVVRHLIIPSMSDTLWGAFHMMIFNVVIFLMVYSHLKAVLTDPGVVPLPKTSLDFSDMHSGQKRKEKEDGWTVCMKCETYRPPRAHHCRICQRCVRRMDHHCPWINNCVGEFNQKFFIQFLFYVGIISMYSISLVIAVWVSDPETKSFEVRHTRIVHSIVLVVEAILFGLFVMAIGCDQMQAILSDETAVEQVKKSRAYKEKRSRMALLQEVFGSGSVALWMCPFPMHRSTDSLQDFVV
ncbi:hypothetical protein CAPTEDRAFT_172289 [Capitella teleta]|uniref:Palmitoyltransferase n=1 Tax=Capitella teleta TaxID=283909 RepID=R7U5Y0_CAPTE|nr:hypothetical protein CAPTEDRAFT_172289 [Capitella teleta]|eukprot:ELU01775.1 hypothetical protein CAPTEDRAFT_172289 [Capitella teleta]